MNRRFVSSILKSLATTGVATICGFAASAAEPASEPQTISLAVYFLDATGKPTPEALVPKNLVIELGAIAGSIGGSPDAQIRTMRVGANNEVRLDIAELTAQLGKHAAPFRERTGTPFELSPVDTRFARVSTVAATGAVVLPGMAVTFWDSKANGSLLPFYCDRPCRLRGLNSDEAFDLNAPEPGLVWMLTTKNPNSHFVHERSVNPRPVVVIAPPEALERITLSTFAQRG